MTVSFKLTGYDLSDEGPGRTVNEDATLVRDDLGLFAIADGAGGRGKGNVAATLALRTIENYVGATVKRTYERADFDALGLPEQAKRLSAAVHQAHGNVLEVVRGAPDRKGMATTVAVALFAPRTGFIHIANVGDSRCYRLRHGRLELLSEDHTVATDVLERRPELADEVLAALPRNSVVRALGMEQDFRVSLRSLPLISGDRYLLCTDGLTSVVADETICAVMNEPETATVLASELLSHALAHRSQDNISVLVVDVDEFIIEPDVPTQRYTEFPPVPPSEPIVEAGNGPSSGDFDGPEVVSQDVVAGLESWPAEADEAETEVYAPVEEFDAAQTRLSPRPAELSEEAPSEPTPDTKSSAQLSSVPAPVGDAQLGDAQLGDAQPGEPGATDTHAYNVSETDIEIEGSDELRDLFDNEEEVSEVFIADLERKP